MRLALALLLLLTSPAWACIGTAAGASGAALECGDASLDPAQRSLEDARKGFQAGDSRSAHAKIDESVERASRSVECTLQSRHGEKRAEIALRKLIRRMSELRNTLDTEDRGHLAEAVAALEKQRDRLLAAMFGDAAKRERK